MEKRFTGQVALITGGGRGIGAWIARLLAQQGAQVMLVARTESQLQQTARQIELEGGSAFYCVADVADEATMRALVERTQQITGRIDILVNNAGSARAGLIEQSDPAEWWQVIESNLRGLYLATRFVLPIMLEQGRGQIVNMLTVAASRPFTGLSAYSCAKAAGLMFTRILAREVRKRGIRVSAVLPGAVDTDLWNEFPNAPERERMIRPETVAQIVLQILATPPDASIDELVVLPPEGIL
ncbi:putative oxidoreductase [bacterium HR15]|nr:putative oxidoreductase [bacterium HR15]